MLSKETIKLFAIITAITLILTVGLLIHNQVREHHLQDDPVLNKLREEFTVFFSQDKYWNGHLAMLNNRDIMNEINLFRGKKSFTLNKEKVFICLKDEKSRYYGFNMLVYVTAHEISHALCVEQGHTELFHTIFQELLDELTISGVYNPSIPIQQNYCSTGDSEI